VVLVPGLARRRGIFKRVHVLPIETFDSGATPKAGEKRVEPKKRADVDVEVLRKQMAATIERAAADDPKALQKKVAELQAQVKKLEAAKVPAAKVEIREVYVVKDSQVTRLTKAIEKLDTLRDRMAQAQQVSSSRECSARPSQGRPGRQASTRRSRWHRQAPTAGSGSCAGCRCRLSPTYAAHRLSSGDRVTISDAGRALAGTVRTTPTTPDELREAWLRILPDYERELLRVLLDVYPAGLTREEIGQRSGKSPASSSFDAAMASLKRNELIDGSRGDERASPKLLE
jgi:hypothetical protein